MRKYLQLLIVLMAVTSSCTMKNPNPLIGTWQLVKHEGNNNNYEFNPAIDKKKIYFWFKNDSTIEIRNELNDSKQIVNYKYANDTISYLTANEVSKKTVVKREGNDLHFSDADEKALLKKVDE